VYVTYSKHLHIFLAFPNTWYSNLKPKGEMANMPEVTQEVNLMLGIPVENPSAPPAEIGRFGAKDINDLSWVNVLNAYSCTECGRCSSECPANLTGKKQTQLLVVILESLHKDEAELFVKLIKKDLGVKYLTLQIVREAFPNLNLPPK
jgi:ferredoxin